MNIMYVSVSERKREIGIRRAIGTKPRNILLQFLLEVAFITWLGGITGIAVGYGMVCPILMATFADGLTTVLSLYMLLLAVGVSTGIGLVFGVISVLKAVRIDTIKAIYM